MSLVPRRAFLKMIFGLVAFAPAIRNLAAQDSDRSDNFSPKYKLDQDHSGILPPPPPPGASLVVEQFAAGNAVEVTPDRIVISTPDRGDVILHLSPNTESWEGRYVGDIPIVIGDDIRAWGPLRTETEHDVEKIWANLVNLRGTISDVVNEPGGLHFHHRDPRQGTHLVKLEPRTLIAVTDGPKIAFRDKGIHLREGQPVQVIGRKLRDGTVLATDVYAD